MQVTDLLLGLYVLLEVVARGVTALPISTGSYGGTLERCVDCQGSRRAGRWRGGQGPEQTQIEKDGQDEKQAATLGRLLGHIDTTLRICEDRNYDRDATPGPRFMDYTLPLSHLPCPNEAVALATYTEQLTSTLASYITLLQHMAHTEADYQTEVIDTDPAFRQLAAHTQTAACELRLSVGEGSLCDRRPVPVEAPVVDYLERFWWDARIVSDLKTYVASARQCLGRWQTRHV